MDCANLFNEFCRKSTKREINENSESESESNENIEISLSEFPDLLRILDDKRHPSYLSVVEKTDKVWNKYLSQNMENEEKGVEKRGVEKRNVERKNVEMKNVEMKGVQMKGVEKVTRRYSDEVNDKIDRIRRQKLEKYLSKDLPIIGRKKYSNEKRKLKPFNVYTTKLKDIRSDIDNVRSGAIIYTHYKGITYFCLGIDYSSGDLTDFSGGVKKSEGVVKGGLRELEEESLGIFGNISVESVQDSTGFYSNNMLIMFIYKDIQDIYALKKNFHILLEEKHNAGHNIEVSDIVWLNQTEFLNSINCHGRKMYSRIRRVLYRVSNFIESL